MADAYTSLQIRSLAKEDGELLVSLAEVEIGPPGPDEVVIRIEASPVNPSDLGLLVGMADLSQARQTELNGRPAVAAPLSEAARRAMAARAGQDMPVGNEGAGVVVAAGASDAAQALMGKTVAALGGEMYAQYRKLHVSQTMALPDGTPARDGASCFVNPLTALGMVETMKAEGHAALAHTAAASNLGQMLVKICKADGVPLVNVVRRAEQAELLKEIGASHAVVSSQEGFMEALIDALAETGATLGFDAVGGGDLAGRILVAMEAAASRGAEFSRYGSGKHKQVYIYGRLDFGPTILPPGVGMAWGCGGWLLTPFLQKIGSEGRNTLRARVVSELHTTFASSYAKEISLAEALDLDTMRAYAARSTGEKALINPNKGM